MYLEVEPRSYIHLSIFITEAPFPAYLQVTR